MDFWISQLFNGVSYGALLFLLAGGLSLIFGMMRIVNMTHGSYYLLGGYVALTVIWRTGSFALAVVLGALTISLVGIAEWNAFLKRLSGQELGQVLTTMGFALIFQDLALVLWGGDPYTISVPAALSGSLVVGQLYFPVYRIFIVVVAGGFVGVYPGADFEILPYAFVVVIVGGMGSLKGALIGSLMVGLLDNFGKALFPELSYFTLFAPMAAILAVRPTGLFGRA